MKLAFAHSEAGKAVAYIQKVALDLVKARRENGHSDKVLDHCLPASISQHIYVHELMLKVS